MGYRVIYLDGEEGRPKKNCKICEKLERNVIEPVAVFLLEDKNLSDLSKEELEKFDTCIFHCDKENEIWMKNLEEYKEWKKRRDEADAKGEEFNEPFEIEWEESLVDEFWNRLRAYRFAVDFYELWANDWENFIFGLINNNVFSNIILSYPEAIEKGKIINNKQLVIRYIRNLQNFRQKDNIIEHDFRKFKFPKCSCFYGTKENCNFSFWFLAETNSFRKKVNFNKSIFFGNFSLYKLNLLEEASFEDATFHGLVELSNFSFKKKSALKIVNFSILFLSQMVILKTI